MYWNSIVIYFLQILSKINYNMRCIETNGEEIGYTVYLDKLQHEMYWNIIDNK